MALVRNINFSRQNLAMNLFRRVDKGRLYIVRRLGGSFHKDQAVGFGKGFALRRTDRPALLQVVLISNQHNDHVGLSMLTGFLQPSRQMLKGVSPSNVVDQEGSRRAAVVTTGDTSEGFLSRGIPDLQLDELVVQVDHAGTKFDPDCQVMDGLESLVGELQQQTRLADA